MENNIKSNTTFWTEISNYKIQVPYYQRDYAQGRTDGGRIDNIRKVFVKELYQAIKGERICHLGLVFGSYDTDNSTFIAVDGQQRLTTVFLLHWYVAWRENKLDDYKEFLKKFSWNTRSYSSQFVELLFKINSPENVINAIKKNCNYFSIWENDPTVKGMLTMLKEIECQYPESEDGICLKLFSNDCKIKYDILKLEKNSDGITYLKMNSRGRSLTTFELFKSKFIDKYKPSFANNFDNKWLTFMLKMSKDDDGSFADPDISYMNFINEYTYMILSLYGDSDKELKTFIDAKMEGNLTDVPFISFDKYETAFKNKLDSFGNFFDWVINNYDDVKEVDKEFLFPKDTFFIEEIIKSNKPKFAHRTKLYSLFKYAELTNYTIIDKEIYKKWNRVFRNLVENTEIDSNNFSETCKAINQIENADIYSYLASRELNTFDKGQVTEEIAKAKKIESGEKWKSKIIEAEKYAFFKGSIRFLFTDGDGNVTEDSWKQFDTKWDNAQKYFDDNGVKDDEESKYKTNAILLKAVLYHVEDFWTYIEPQKFVLDNTASTWKNNILLEHGWKKSVHEILIGNLSVEERNDDCLMYKNLYKTDLLDYVANYQTGSRIRWHHGHRTIYPPRYDGIMLDDENRDVPFFRNRILSTTSNVSSEQKIEGKDFFKGWNINFEYNKDNNFYDFQWNTDGNVYLIEKNNRKEKEDGSFYCFKADGIDKSENFIEELDNLIKDAQENGIYEQTSEQ